MLAAAVGPRFDRTLSHRRRVAYREKLHEELDLADGLREWLDEAAGLRLRLAVASSSPRDWLTTHLRRAGVLDMFEVLAGGDEVGQHKPAPDVYQLALDRLTLSCAAAVAVEDTAHGVTAAHTAGMRCIAIPNPFVALERVRQRRSGPDLGESAPARRCAEPAVVVPALAVLRSVICFGRQPGSAVVHRAALAARPTAQCCAVRLALPLSRRQSAA